MEQPPQKLFTIGFVSIWEHPNGELRGGYLLTTEHGRPVEFHYTQPLRFSSQERLLYGKQFGPLVHSELIAKPLTDRQTNAPKAIITDRPSLLFLRRHVPAPVLCLTKPAPLQPLRAIANDEFPNDRLAFERLAELVPKNFDWLEPFERILAALEACGDTALRLAA